MKKTRDAELGRIATIVAAPAVSNRGRRTFDIHPGVHLILVGCYLAFVSVLVAAFMGQDLVVATAIILLSVVALFGVPALWARVEPDDGAPKQSWAEFQAEGMDCLTGRLTAGEALAQILVLPGLIVALGAIIAIIKISL